MKKNVVLLMVVVLLPFAVIKAQTVGKLYGMTALGGDSSGGVLFNYDVATSRDSLCYQFSAYSPVYPNYNYSSLIQATDGNFYGISELGGSADYGVVFRCTPAGRMTVIANFTGGNGQQPRGSLVQANDGNLYGMAVKGGAYGDGVIFKCTLAGVLDTLISFNGINGISPESGSLIQATDNNLYGMTEGGGRNNDGVIFRCSTTGVYDTLFSFNDRTGGEPWGSLVQASDNKLYGMTTAGGRHGYGVIFRYSLSGVYDTLASFNYYNGQIPYGNLVQAKDGNFYGMAYGGGAANEGTLFKYDTTARVIDTLVSFNGANGENPVAGLILAADGNLYGATPNGGSMSDGTIFKYNLTTKTFGTLVSFTDNGPAGKYPISNLIQTAGGNLYGLTWQGGASGNGALFQCTTGGTLSVIYNVGTTYLGYYPYGSLIQASDGYLYGLADASYSSNNGNGTLFRCLPSGTDMNTLVVFTGANGLNPYGKLIQASDGNLYGMAHGGGSHGYGIIFKYTLPGGVFDTLASFNYTNGASPWGSLIQGFDGNFYGVTSLGGADGYGVIFKCTTSGVISVLYSFTGFNDGANPHGSLIQGKDSVLYGTTEQGGSESAGTIFKCTTSGTYKSIAGLGGASLQVYPYGSLVQGVDGNLYGLSSQGGASGMGGLFKCTTSGVATNLFSFTGAATGSSPQGSLIQATDSSLYGMTTTGGEHSYGVLFKYNIASGVYDTLLSFNKANGASPQYGNLLELMNVSINSSPTCSGYQLTVLVNGSGVGALSYLWSTNATTPFINITTAGTYSVRIKNTSGTYSTASIVVPTFSGNPGAIVTTNTVNDVTCSGCNNGSASVTVTGGYKNVIAWSDSTASGYAVLTNHASDTANNLTVGTYVCTVTDSCGQSVTDTIRIRLNLSSGIQTITPGGNGINIYPLPSNDGRFTMSLNGTGYRSVTIYDETGKEIYARTLNTGGTMASVQLDLSMQASGIYFAKVVTDDGVINRKIIIQR